MTMATNPNVTANSRRENSLLLALTAGASFALVYAIAVRTPFGQALDTRAMLDISARLADQSWPARVLGLVSPLSVIAATTTLSGLVAVWRGRSAAVDVVAVTGGTILAAGILKAVLARPEFFDGSTNSLPSGHVAAVAGLTAATVVALPATLRPWTVLIGTAATTITGVATLALQWHRPSDVVAAALIAVLAAALTTAHHEHTASHAPGTKQRLRGRPRRLLSGIS